MAIQDSDPERRNLVVTSLGFIVFYLADGQVTEESFRLQMIPITFNNIIVLKLFAWGMLFWFAVRYWQTHQQSFENSYRSYLNKYNSKSNPSKYYLKKKLSIDRFPDYDKGFRSDSFVWHGANRWIHVQYRIVEEATKEQNHSYSIKKENSFGPEPLTGFLGIKEHIKYFLSFSIKTDGFTSYVAPYMFFAFALLIPAYKYLAC